MSNKEEAVMEDRRTARSDVEPLPPPVPSEDVGIWELVIADMHARDAFGRQKYGTALHVDDGRSGLVDLIQELLDAVVYTKKAILQQEQGIVIETIQSVHAMTRAIGKRTQSSVIRSIAERDALLGLYQEVVIALDLLPRGA